MGQFQKEGTLPETKIAPARKPSQKETSLPTSSNHPFPGAMLVSGMVNIGAFDFLRLLALCKCNYTPGIPLKSDINSGT